MFLKVALPILLTVLLTFTSYINCLSEGDACVTKNGESGTCKLVKTCPRALAEFQKKIMPTICTILRKGRKREAVVCCPELIEETTTPASYTCAPHSKEKLKITKIENKKAYNYCIDIIDIIFPCVKKEGMLKDTYNYLRGDLCSHMYETQIVGGEEAKENEFPHMVLLGFDHLESEGGKKWDCGGSLISDQWVLTAAHCVFSRVTRSSVKYARIGIIDMNVNKSESNFNIVDTKKHPNYNVSQNYDDIALLKLDRKVTFSNSIIPACLYTGDKGDIETITATGWGLTNYATKSRENYLMKVNLNKFQNSECAPHVKSRKLKQGLNAESQICYGHRTKNKDTCQGDSGGPIQALNDDVYCAYNIVGVTSFGIGCGTIGKGAIYTNVAHYVPWIESIVWP